LHEAEPEALRRAIPEEIWAANLLDETHQPVSQG